MAQREAPVTGQGVCSQITTTRPPGPQARALSIHPDQATCHRPDGHHLHFAADSLLTVYGEAHRSLRRLEPDPSNRRKYIDFIDIYAALDDEEQQRYKEHYVEEGKEMMGMRERFQQEGRQQGLVSGRQQTLAELLVERFGPLDARVTARIASASLDELKRWTRQILTARTLEEVFRGQ